MIISNIERVSALYLTKTIYSVLLNVIFIIIGRAYPFVPIHLSLISAGGHWPAKFSSWRWSRRRR